jgi:hypothetical protein
MFSRLTNKFPRPQRNFTYTHHLEETELNQLMSDVAALPWRSMCCSGLNALLADTFDATAAATSSAIAVASGLVEGALRLEQNSVS